jgi:hypothetical protein
MTTTALSAASTTRRGANLREPVLVSLVWVAIGVTWLIALVVTGSPLADVAKWVGVVVIGVLLPGVALVRAARAMAAPLVEDLAWGAAAGCVVALAGWFLDVTLPWSVPPWLWGPLVAVATLIAPRTRTRVLARPARGWGLRPNLALAVGMLVAIAWMTTDYLRFNPADPGPRGHTYYPDTLFQLAVVGQLRHSVIPRYPLVHGESFAYHWFLHAVLAHLLTGTGVDPFDAVLRLTATTLLPAVLVLLAVVARRVADRVWAGPVAAALFAVTGTTVATVWTTDGQTQPIVGTYWAASLTTTFGWLATLAVAGCVVAIIRNGPPDRAIPHHLVIPLTILAAGAKSTDLAVLVVGASAALVVTFVTRRRVIPALAVTALVGVTLLVAKNTLYGGTEYGLRWAPFAGIANRAAAMFPGLVAPSSTTLFMTTPRLPELVLIAVFLLWLLPLLPRLVGFIPLLRQHSRDPLAWFLIGTTVAGFGATLAYRQPGSSEILFLSAAYPIGLIGSAWGLVLLPVQRVAACVGAATGIALTLGTAAIFGTTPGITTWTATHGHAPTRADIGEVRQILLWAAPLALLTAALAVLAVLAWILLRRRRSAVLTVGIAAAVLGTGLLSTGLYLTTAGMPSYNHSQATATPNTLPTTRDEITAGRWLAANSAPTDVLAVNRTCLQPLTATPPCTAKDFAISAISGRDTDVGGWAYAPRNLDSSWSTNLWYANQPFWDAQRLAQETTAFTHPTAASLTELYQQGVRWLVADQGGHPPNTATLDTLATRRLTLPTITIWQLK